MMKIVTPYLIGSRCFRLKRPIIPKLSWSRTGYGRFFSSQSRGKNLTEYSVSISGYNKAGLFLNNSLSGSRTKNK